MARRRRFLFWGGIASMSLALFHISIIFGGASALRYFGAGERLVALAEAGSIIPALITIAIALIFTVFSLYAFSAASHLRPLPMLKGIVWSITAIYLLRGVIGIFELVLSFSSMDILKELTFSIISLGIGLVHLAGIAGNKIPIPLPRTDAKSQPDITGITN